MTDFRFDPETYPDEIRADIPEFERLQNEVASATRGIEPHRILELGTGTGETARRVLELHPQARLVGIDESEAMLAVARERIEGELVVSRLEDELPEGPFELVFSALAIHHLEGSAKRDVFQRIARVLVPRGRFVLGDVIVPVEPEEAAIPLTSGFDLPDRLDDQLAWLAEAGFEAEPTWLQADLAVVRARRAT